VTLHGSAEFVAEGVDVEGTHAFEVPSGHTLTLSRTPGGPRTAWTAQLVARAQEAEPSWAWRHELVPGGAVRLVRELPPFGPWLNALQA